MNKLKPVAWMWEYRGFSFVTGSEAKAIELQEDPEIEVTPLYAIPDKLNDQWLPPPCPVYQHHVSIDRCDDVDSGAKKLKGFPRGKLLSDTEHGKVYSFDPDKVIAWLVKNGLISA